MKYFPLPENIAGKMDELANKLIAISQIGATSFENSFDHRLFLQWTGETLHIPAIIVVIYLLFIRYGSQYMEKKAAFDLQYVLAFWNAFLSIFSAIGFLRTVPYCIAVIIKQPDYYHLVCDNGNEFFDGPCGIWMAAFMLSKVPELIDTVFIVLRKKPLGFLHWYHHVTVLLYCWHAYSTHTGAGILFCAMNYTVHSIMYAYYCMQALKCVPKGFPSQIITLVQIAQMVVGVHVCATSAYHVYKGHNCDITENNLIAAILMYASYLYLFCEFAFKRYLMPKKKSEKKA